MRRRGFLGWAATGLTLPAACRGPAEVEEWTATGVAFGTETAITLTGLPEDRARELFDKAFAEAARIEAIFTLFEPQSPLRRLNDSGELADPPAEMREVLAVCDRVHDLTGGAFDPTVQPLWEIYERHFAENPTDTEGPGPKAIAAARDRIGWGRVSIARDRIRYDVSGMAMTLNGVAPGYAADRVAAFLKAEGVKHALVDIGENRAIGSQPDGSPWKIGVRGPDDETLLDEIGLDGNALAISAGYATAFDLTERFHHLFHPIRSEFQPARRVIVVQAPEAALADALATAGGVMEFDDLRKSTRSLKGVTVREYEAEAAGQS